MGDKGNEYAVPKPGRLNLRETNAEREARLRRKAEKEFKKYDEGIRRANGIGGPSGSTQFSNLNLPNTNKPFGSRVHFEENEFEPSLAHPLSGYHGRSEIPIPIPIPIPSRHIHTHTHTHTHTFTRTSTSTHTHTHGHHTTTFTTSHTGNMNDEESVRYMKRQMEFARQQTLKAEAELLAEERRRKEEMRWRDELAEEERREKRRERRAARERKERMEDQKARDRERGDTPEYTYTYTYSNHGNRSRQHHPSTHGSTSNLNSGTTRRKEQDRQRYLSRWKSLLANTSSSDDEIIEVQLTYSDIPWPIYNDNSTSSSSLDKITKESIKTFLSDLSTTTTSTGTGAKIEMKRILREAIKNFHPDRFTSKVLNRVRADEREKVREGMEICSRALTDLIGENARS